MGHVSRLPTTFLCALVFSFSVAEASAPRCPAPLPIESGNPEYQVAQIAGNAILFPFNSELGVEWATGCLLGWFDRPDFGLADLTGTVSDALLAMMTVSPSRFFSAATEATPGQLSEWLGGSVRYSQNQFMGRCVQPDKFAQARSAIDSLRLDDPRQEALRQRVLSRLAGMKCQLVEG